MTDGVQWWAVGPGLESLHEKSAISHFGENIFPSGIRTQILQY